MGVPRLFPWLINNFRNYVNHFTQGEFTTGTHYLYLDANGLLHSAAQTVFNYGDGKKAFSPYEQLSYEAKILKVYELFFENIIKVSTIVTPTEVLFIAIDGPAPLAKQAQQRQRRYIAARDRPQTSSGQFDSNCISPGTEFMQNLSLYINTSVRRLVGKHPSFKGIRVVYSPVSVPGEGEHKIMDYIRSLPVNDRLNKTHTFFGPDGDLIMLTLSSHVPNMFLFREDQYNTGKYHLINMGAVRQQLPVAMGISASTSMSVVRGNSRTITDAVNDFEVCGFFVGNDFLPKIQMFLLLEDGLELMLNVYANVSKGGSVPLTIDSKLQLKGFSAFVKKLATYEKSYLLEQVTTNDTRKQPPEDKFKNTTLLKAVTENPLPVIDMEVYRYEYYKKIGIEVGDTEGLAQISKMCGDYIRTFAWVLGYYITGLPSWKWAYEYHYPPLMIDLDEYLTSIMVEDWNMLLSFELGSASKPFEQLLSVLPPASSRLLPKKYAVLMTSEKSPLVQAGVYPKTFDVDYEGKLKDYQGIALLPFVDYQLVHKVYEKMEGKTRKYKRDEQGLPVLYRYDKNYCVEYSSVFGVIPNLHVHKFIIGGINPSTAKKNPKRRQ